MQCEMCGKDEQLFRAKIEGTYMSVCGVCSSHGNVLKAVRNTEEERPKSFAKQEDNKEEVVTGVVSDFALIIRKKREGSGLSQRDFAQKIMEKESVVQHLENGGYEPSLKLAEKLERVLGIKLVEQYAESFESGDKVEAGEMTLGDVIKIKKRSK